MTVFSGLHDPARWVLPDVLTEAAAKSPDAEWLTDSAGQRMTFAGAESSARTAAGFFHGLGIRRDDRVGMLMFNGCDFVRAWLGLGKLAATAVLLNTELRGGFLHHQITDSGIACLLIDAELYTVLRDIAAEIPTLKTVVVAGPLPPADCAGWRTLSWQDYLAAPEWDGPGPKFADLACIMYTSGTTGPSKGVMMPHAHCTLYGVGSARCMALTADDRYYVSLPLFHANGLLIQLGATLLMGIPAFIRSRFSASRWLPDIRDNRCTVTNLLGSTVAFVLAQPSGDGDQTHRLRAVMTAPNLPQHEAEMRRRFGLQDVVSGFGMTECNIPIWGQIGRSVPGAAGWVHDDHFEVCIANPEDDRPLAPGEVGEILIRPKIPSGFMVGYHNAPGKTVEAWRNLWFHTGDAGTIGVEGLVTYIDRLKDCIRRRGQNISAVEIEAVVEGLPGIAEAAAVAVPSDIPGTEDEVLLVLVPIPGETIDCYAVMRRAAEQLPRFARPRYVRVTEELPKTATGKVQRAVLRRQGTAGAQDVGSMQSSGGLRRLG